MSEVRALVCGGRFYDDTRTLFRELDRLRAERGITQIVCGAQRHWVESKQDFVGADWLAIEWALSRQVPFIGHPAEWKARGRAAGPIRNAAMDAKWKPDLGIAFPGGDGTAGMIGILGRRRIEVIRVPEPSL
jgi:hypothetical protein